MEEKNCVGKLLFLILILSLMNFEVFSRKEKFFRLFCISFYSYQTLFYLQFIHYVLCRISRLTDFINVAESHLWKRKILNPYSLSFSFSFRYFDEQSLALSR